MPKLVCLASPAGADQLQLLGMHLHGTKKSRSPRHAATPQRQPSRAHMRFGAMASTRPPQLEGELSSKKQQPRTTRWRRSAPVRKMARGPGAARAEGRERLGGGRSACWHSLTHTTPSCLQVEEEDERKKDSGRAHEVELQLLSLFIDTSSQGEHLQGKAL